MKVEEGIRKYLDISTAHITREDNLILSRHDGTAHIGVIADPFPFGYWVYANETPLHIIEDLKAAKVAGFSASFRRLIAKAFRLGCTWIKLDRDGFVYGDLAQYSW